jgi:predicted DsbA family dithiol-disulfide isomerase
MKATIFGDYVCPFCFLEIPALEKLRDVDGIELDFRAYELRPEPVETLNPRGQYLTNTWARAVYPMAEQMGIPIKLPPVQPRSRLAFEGLMVAKTAGKDQAYNKAIYEAFFQQGRDIGDGNVVVDVGRSVGIAPDVMTAALNDHRYLPDVLADEAEAAQLGITGVPAVIVNGHMLVGCQSYEELRSALTTL